MKAALLLLIATFAHAGEVVVRDATELKAALRDLKPGTVLKIAPGDYPGGHHVSGVETLTTPAIPKSLALSPSSPANFNTTLPPSE